MELGFIKGTATPIKTRKTKVWQFKQIPTMYTPAHIKQTTDMSLFYEKPPSEMSRYELQELETLLRELEEGDENTSDEEEEEVTYDDEGNIIERLVLFKQTDEFMNNKDEIRKL